MRQRHGTMTIEKQQKVACPPHTTPRAIDAMLGGALLLALATRIVCAIPQHICFGDESCYIYLAQNLFSGKGFTYYNNLPELHFPPLFPIVLGLFNLVTGDWELVTRVAYVVFGTLLIVPLYLLARSMYGRSVARLAAFVTALLPAFTTGVLFAETMGEPLYLFCLACGIACLWGAAGGGKWPHFAGTGAFFALAYLTRPEGMLYFFLAMGCLPLVFLRHRRLTLRQAACRLGVLAAAYFTIAFPYLVYVRIHLGQWSLTTKGTTTYTTTRALVTRNGSADGAAFLRDTWGLDAKGEVHYFSHEYGEGMLSLLLGRYRDRLLHDVAANTEASVRTIRKYAFFGQPLLLLALSGLVMVLWRRRRWEVEIFNFVLLAPLAMFLVFFIQDRYLYPLLFPLIFWTACALDGVVGWLGAARFPGLVPASLAGPGARRALQVSLLAALALYLCTLSRQTFAKGQQGLPDIWDCESVLTSVTPPEAVVIAAYPQVPFHASRRWLPLPVAPLDEVLRYARERGGTHLIVAAWHLRDRPEHQRELLRQPGPRPGLELIAYEGAESDKAFVIYRLAD